MKFLVYRTFRLSIQTRYGERMPNYVLLLTAMRNIIRLLYRSKRHTYDGFIIWALYQSLAKRNPRIHPPALTHTNHQVDVAFRQSETATDGFPVVVSCGWNTFHRSVSNSRTIINQFERTFSRSAGNSDFHCVVAPDECRHGITDPIVRIELCYARGVFATGLL